MSWGTMETGERVRFVTLGLLGRLCICHSAVPTPSPNPPPHPIPCAESANTHPREGPHCAQPHPGHWRPGPGSQDLSQVALTGSCHPASSKLDLLAESNLRTQELPFGKHFLGTRGKRQGDVSLSPILSSVPDLGILAVCGTRGCLGGTHMEGQTVLCVPSGGL